MLPGRVGRQVVDPRVVDPAARVLDVVRVVAEPAQADQVVQELVRHPGQRIPEEDPEDDDLALGRPSCSSRVFLVRCEPPDDARRVAGDDRVRRHVLRHDRRAPTTAPSPIVTPGSTQPSKPIQTFRPMRIGRACRPSEVSRRGCGRPPAPVPAPRARRRRDPVRVHEHDVPGDQRVVADLDLRVADDPRPVDQGVVAQRSRALRPDVEHRAEIGRSAAADPHRRPARSLRYRWKLKVVST